jgi:hypothetical protein
MENASRAWREIARELARETDSLRAWELSQELNKALAEEEALHEQLRLRKD